MLVVGGREWWTLLVAGGAGGGGIFVGKKVCVAASVEGECVGDITFGSGPAGGNRCGDDEDAILTGTDCCITAAGSGKLCCCGCGCVIIFRSPDDVII